MALGTAPEKEQVMTVITPQGHSLGWIKPPLGRRAIDLLPPADITGLTILPEVDPRKKMPPALNQLALGSCTANATNRCFRYDTIMDGKDCGELSRLYTYYYERELEGTLGQGDAGAMGHDAFVVAQKGIPSETLWPYDITKFEEKPPTEPFAYTLTKPVHAVPQTENDFKAVLSNNQTIAYGFTVYRGFEEPWQTPGVMPEPNQNEEVLGGHETLISGYLKEYPDHALILNSWGEWGLNNSGYFLFPWKSLLNPNIASDFRTVVRTTV